MSEFENKLRMELSYKGNSINSSKEFPSDILNAIDKRHKMEISRTRFKKYAAAIACSLLICTGVTFISSTNVRTAAMEIIKNVFVLGSNGKVVEKPANEIFLTPACSYNSNLSDEDMSKKIGVDIYFPKEILSDFKLTGKSDGAGVIKSVDYVRYHEVLDNVAKAIKDQDVFDSLKEYDPYRTAGGCYEDNSGDKIGIYVASKNIPIPDTNVARVNIAKETKVQGIKAIWLDVKGLDNSDDLTQKTNEKFAGNCLLWSTDRTTYFISPMEGCKSFTFDMAVKLANAFMNEQE